MNIKKNLLITFVSFLSIIYFSNSVAKINFEQFKTSKGINTIFVNDKTTDIVSIYLAFKGAGSKSDPVDKYGLSQKAIELLIRSDVNGVNKYERSNQLVNLGSLNGFSYHVTKDDIFLNFKCPKANISKVLDIVVKTITNLELSNSELAVIKDFTDSNEFLSTADPLTFASNALFSKLFNSHPYQNSVAGSLEKRQTITLEDIKKYIKSNFTTNNLTIVAVGDVNKKELTKVINVSLKDLPTKYKEPKIDLPKVNTSGQIDIIRKDSSQSSVVFAQGGLKSSDKDYLALSIINDVIGKQFTGRLWIDIREDKGLVYDIGTSFTEMKMASIWVGDFQCDNKDVNFIVNTIRSTWNDIKTNGIKKDEFEAAKEGLIGSYALNFTSNESISATLLSIHLSDNDLNYINTRNDRLKTITLEDVNNVAKKYMTPEKLTFLVVGNP